MQDAKREAHTYIYKDHTIQWTGKSSGGINSWIGTHPDSLCRFVGTSKAYVMKCIDYSLNKGIDNEKT